MRSLRPIKSQKKPIPRLIPDVDYREIPATEYTDAEYAILSGKYKGLIFTYNSARFEEHPDCCGVSLIFDYEILQEPDDATLINLKEDNELRNVIGDILVSILDN